MKNHYWIKEVLKDLDEYAKREQNSLPEELGSAISYANQTAGNTLADYEPRILGSTLETKERLKTSLNRIGFAGSSDS